MNTEVKNKHSEIVHEIKQEVIKLTQKNLVLRNCWEKEQAENEDLRRRVRGLLEENAAYRCRDEDLRKQIIQLQRGLLTVESLSLLPPRSTTNRIHNLEDGTIFKGNSPAK